MPVRRPNIGPSDPEEEQNRRGPRPGRGTNQGRGAVDVADRTQQGFSDGQRPVMQFVSDDEETDDGNFVLRRDGSPSDVLRSEWSGLYDAQGNPIPSSDPRAERFAAAAQAGQGADTLGGGLNARQQRERGAALEGTGPTDVAGRTAQPGEDREFPVESPGQAARLEEITGLIEQLERGTAADIAARYIDPTTGTPIVSFPEWQGEEVFFGQDLLGNQGYGIIDADGEFTLAPGAIQNQAAAVNDAIQFAQNFYASTSADARNLVISEYLQGLNNEAASIRQQAAQEFETTEREAAQGFRTEEREDEQAFATGEREARERFESLQRETDRKWEEYLLERGQTFTDAQNELDRALRITLFEMENGIRFGDFAEAERRAEQEIQLRNAQFALQLMQTISAAPEALLAMRQSGFLQQVQEATGLNLNFLAGIPDAQAGSALQEVQLPTLAELQQMPADIRDSVITRIAATTGVRRETVLAEIQRRSSGMGLGSTRALQRAG